MKNSAMITTRNRCEELRHTLERLFELQPRADEVLVCADGCTDGTAEMVRQQFPKCILLENELARGSVFSRDRLLRAASGDIVASFDDDSYPLDKDFFARVEQLFGERDDTAVIAFPEVRDGEEPAHPGKTASSPPHLVSAYANCAAAMRRDVYLGSQGFPAFFGHMYEEPDYALQCYALGYVVRFEPSVRVRHHVSAAQREPIRRHHLNARNELWSVFMRCPFPQLIVVALFRIWRQLRYAYSERFAWAVREPRWWWSALMGVPRCIRHRQPIDWLRYYAWMKLARHPILPADDSASAAQASA
jgi:GT2 family glycosyltransferase